MKNEKQKLEQDEAFMRVLVFIVTGIIIRLWGILAKFLILVNWIINIFTGTRNKEIAEFIEQWNATVYTFIAYLSGLTNKRPFPFNNITTIRKYEK